MGEISLGHAAAGVVGAFVPSVFGAFLVYQVVTINENTSIDITEAFVFWALASMLQRLN